MKLHFLGANRQVTGSRYCLEVGTTRVMVDCGMFQERPYVNRNWEPGPLEPQSVDALLLTHAHLDHCGLIPRFVASGFAGPIHCTAPTVALSEVIMTDSAKIQEEDAAYKKKRHRREKRKGAHPELPLYTQADVEKTLPHLQGHSYGESIEVGPGIRATFHDAGHILGSAMIECELTESGETRRILFSGDIGQWGKPLIRDPSLFDRADYVVMESTYGDRQHHDGGDILDQLDAVIRDTVARGGNVVIPTFAVERAQELLYYISQLVHNNRIPAIKVFLDSPMAVNVTNIFRQFREYFDEETWQLIVADESPLRFPGLHLARTAQESIAINNLQEPAIIMSSSGMCTGGRIKHHLRRNIERPESTILFVGYQGDGTLGRQILERQSQVRIHGRMYRVQADVAQIFGFSGHSDQDGLLRWIGHLKEPPRHVYLTHGDQAASTCLAKLIGQNLATHVSIPEYDTVVDLN